MNARESVQNLFQESDTVFNGQEAPSTDEDSLSVSPATKRIAYAYERFRNTLEPDEADILRRKAIARILERRLNEDQSATVTAEQLLQELMRASYIPPATKQFARYVAGQLQRAQKIYVNLPKEVAEWFIRIVAVSLDRDLYPKQQDEAVASLMYHDTYSRTEWVDDLVVKEDRPTQLYMACHRALFEADDFEISFHYFLHHFPEWRNEKFSEADQKRLMKELPAFYKRIKTQITHPARSRITRLIRPVAVPYRILRDLLENKTDLTSDEVVTKATKEALQKRIIRLRSRMSKRAWNSILFLFLTKTILALLFEVPYELLLLSRLHWGALAMNIGFHPLLLFMLATTVRMPGKENTERVVDEVQRIIKGETLPTVVIRSTRHYGGATWSVFALFYAILFFVIFWGMFSVLAFFDFTLVAMLMFVVFLGLVSFLAVRIRRSVNEVRIIPPREGAMSTIISFLGLPILEFGRWLTQHISQLNIALFFMDRVLEAPFKVLIDVVEEWFAFVRDRREEIA